jgi:hypothetical protein
MSRPIGGGGAISNVDPNATGVTPAWRSALAHAIHLENWEEGASVEEIEVTRDRTRESLKVMDELAPGSGSYLNEVRTFVDQRKSC